jgi:hypothetical protein
LKTTGFRINADIDMNHTWGVNCKTTEFDSRRTKSLNHTEPKEITRSLIKNRCFRMVAIVISISSCGHYTASSSSARETVTLHQIRSLPWSAVASW